MKTKINLFICLLTALFCLSGTVCFANSYEGPTKGRVSSDYGYRRDPFTGRSKFHKGIDIAAKQGTPIYAMQDGVVVFSGRNGAYGKCVIIDHFFSDIPELPRLKTKYAHNSRNLVSKGQYVKRGQVIAYVGSTGRSTGPHLHFEVNYKENTVNPKEYLAKLPKYLKYAQQVRQQRRIMAQRRTFKDGIGGPE